VHYPKNYIESIPKVPCGYTINGEIAS